MIDMDDWLTKWDWEWTWFEFDKWLMSPHSWSGVLIKKHVSCDVHLRQIQTSHEQMWIESIDVQPHINNPHPSHYDLGNVISLNLIILSIIPTFVHFIHPFVFIVVVIWDLIEFDDKTHNTFNSRMNVMKSNVNEWSTSSIIICSFNLKLQTQSEKSHQMKDGSGDLIANMLKQVECMVVDSLISVKVEDDIQQFDCKVQMDWWMSCLNKGFVDSISHKEQSHNCKCLPSVNNDSVHSESQVPCKVVSQCYSSSSCSLSLIMF